MSITESRRELREYKEHHLQSMPKNIYFFSYLGKAKEKLWVSKHKRVMTETFNNSTVMCVKQKH